MTATGLSLSGGGIRSAAFCLGALQSLAVHGIIDRIDYLSTVSGGGYIGSAVSACMSQKPPPGANQEFPFAAPSQFKDKPAVGHLRDFSNYLLPRGSQSLIDAIAVVLRGIATNLVFVLAFILLLTWATLIAYPDYASLLQGSFVPRFIDGLLAWFGVEGAPIDGIVGANSFALTYWLLGLLGVFLVAWAVSRSRATARGCDVRGPGVQWARTIIIVLIAIVIVDLQPLAVFGIFQLSDYLHGTVKIPGWIAGVSAPFAAIVAFFSDKLAAFLKTANQKPGTAALLQRLAAQAAILLAAIVLPLFLWLSYIVLTAEGIADTYGAHPGLALLSGGWQINLLGHDISISATMGAFAAWIVLTLIAMRFAPNANSLHQLYRDKLSKAFIFDPKWRETSGPDKDDLIPLDKTMLSEIAPAQGGPYHLINAALNLQGSVYANRRGRNAGFFLFSPLYVGSDITDYVETPVMEAQDSHLDLATAMAISGAAVSSNMGSSSIAPLTPTLALLNVRLGYWMKNPKYLGDQTSAGATLRKASELSKAYLLSEILGRIDETAPHVYLTDGGHIENLGLYQLLVRHCRVVVVVDSEADPNMTFSALSTVQRYARIDLGVRIDLPWQDIAKVSNAVTAAAVAGDPIPMADGPHCAVGTIHYPDGEDGLLLYVKASLTGDEADYVLNYKQRNPSFPHESTGDQFFTEEQFEVYRALGFHALDGFLSGKREFTCNSDIAVSAALGFTTVPDFVKSLFPA